MFVVHVRIKSPNLLLARRFTLHLFCYILRAGPHPTVSGWLGIWVFGAFEIITSGSHWLNLGRSGLTLVMLMVTVGALGSLWRRPW